MRTNPGEVRSVTLGKFVKEYGTASGGDWTSMLMSAIRNAARVNPKWKDVWDSMPKDKYYEFTDLVKIIEDNLLEKNPSTLLELKIKKIAEKTLTKLAKNAVHGLRYAEQEVVNIVQSNIAEEFHIEPSQINPQYTKNLIDSILGAT